MERNKQSWFPCAHHYFIKIPLTELIRVFDGFLDWSVFVSFYLSSQTFVNDLRIPDQTYITLKLSDVIRFGYDILLDASPHVISFFLLFFNQGVNVLLCESGGSD